MIFRAFKIHFEIEESIELIKKRMTRRPKFNLTETFKYLDMFDEHILSHECFKRVLMENKHYATNQELNFLFDRFDRNRSGRITFEEFTEEIMPKNTFSH